GSIRIDQQPSKTVARILHHVYQRGDRLAAIEGGRQQRGEIKLVALGDIEAAATLIVVHNVIENRGRGLSVGQRRSIEHETIGAASPIHDVGTSTANEDVIALAAPHLIIARAAVEQVVAAIEGCESSEHAGIKDHPVIPDQEVVAITAEQLIVTARALKTIDVPIAGD